MSITVGDTVGPYTIVEKLGQGGMATVYKAYHEALDRYVAIKVLHPTFKDDDSFLRRFSREAKVVARLEHPHIVPVYDFAEHYGMPYLVMRYIEGETLKDRLNQGVLSRPEILRIAQGIAEALDYAHGQGVLHRDVKPSNVLLTRGGGVYIADFGLARIAQAGESTLSRDAIMGTPQYISPEQARGDKDIDGRTDIYAFGIILYEMVTGQVPFNADTAYSIIHAQIFDPPPAPTQLNEQVSPILETVLLKALNKEVADRYATAGELYTAFQEAITEMPSQMAPANRQVLLDYTPVAATRTIDEENISTLPPLPDLTPPPPDTTIEPEPTPSAVVPAKQKRPLRYILMGIGGGILICCLLTVAVMIIANRADEQNQVATATAVAQSETDRQDVPPPEQSGEPPLQEDGQIPDDDAFIPGNIRPIDELEPLIAEEPHDRQLKWELIAAYVQANRAEDARPLVRDLFPPARVPIAFHMAAERLFNTDHLAIAMLVLEEGLTRYPNDPQIQRFLMLAYLATEQPVERVADLNGRISQQQQDNNTLVVLGEAYIAAHSNDAMTALNMLNDLLENPGNPDMLELLYLKGQTLALLHQPDEALAVFMDLLQHAPPLWLENRTVAEIEALQNQ